jgi:hypothetical protein
VLFLKTSAVHVNTFYFELDSSVEHQSFKYGKVLSTAVSKVQVVIKFSQMQHTSDSDHIYEPIL